MARKSGQGRRTPSAAGRHGRRDGGNREESAPPTRNRAESEPNVEPEPEPEPEPNAAAGNNDGAPQAFLDALAEGGKNAPRKKWSKTTRSNQRKWEAKERERQQEEKDQARKARRNECQRVRRRKEKEEKEDTKPPAAAAAPTQNGDLVVIDDDADEAIQQVQELSLWDAAGRNRPSASGAAHLTDGSNNPGNIQQRALGVLEQQGRNLATILDMSSPDRQGGNDDDDDEEDDDRKLAPGEQPRRK